MIMLIGSVLLILFNTRQNIIFFYTPLELTQSNPSLNSIVRIGAFVKKDSFKKINNNTYEFYITDKVESIRITYKGILPDLFREEQGAVVEGILVEKKFIKADRVYAKHDENYMPITIKKQLENKSNIIFLKPKSS